MSSAHGSDANAGCPSACVRMVSGVRVCDCVGVTTDRTGITLIDGVVPVLDVFQPNWATQLYTATTIQNNWGIEFMFPNHYILRQLEMYLFFCPDLNIPYQGLLSISIYQSILFPRGIKGLLLGNVSLSVEGQNYAERLTRIYIQVPAPISEHSLYLIEFLMENYLGGIYIGEVTFRDETTIISSKVVIAYSTICCCTNKYYVNTFFFWKNDGVKYSSSKFSPLQHTFFIF